jgi:hypothetical protein
VILETDVLMWLLQLDATYVGLVACHIVLQREEQSLGVLGSEDYAAVYRSLWHTWQKRREVDDELRGGVRYNGQIRVVTLRYLWVELYINSVLLQLFHFADMILVL